MRAFVGVVIGLAFGVVFMLTNLLQLARQTLRKEPPATGLELLAPGATAWQPLASIDGSAVRNMWLGKEGHLLVTTERSPFGAWWDGTKWVQTQEIFPTFGYHAMKDGTFWFALDGGKWLTATSGECTPRLELGGEALPAIPRCTAEKFQYQVRTAVRLDDGSLLVITDDGPATERAWRLPPSATAWVDAGAMPFQLSFGKLAAGRGATAIVTGGDGRMAIYDGKSGWRELPKKRSARVGWEAALTPDGTVLAFGGFADRSTGDTAVRVVLFLAVIVAFVVAIVIAKRTYQIGVLWMLLGFPLGIGLAVAALFVIWILIGARI